MISSMLLNTLDQLFSKILKMLTHFITQDFCSKMVMVLIKTLKLLFHITIKPQKMQMLKHLQNQDNSTTPDMVQIKTSHQPKNVSQMPHNLEIVMLIMNQGPCMSQEKSLIKEEICRKIMIRLFTIIQKAQNQEIQKQ